MSSGTAFDDHSPIGPEEILFRRVPANWYDAALDVPVDRVAFEPNKNDTDGISLYRSLFTTAEALSATGRKPGRYYVVELTARELDALGLEVVPAPIPDGPGGHSLVRHLTFEFHARNTGRAKEIERELAKIADSRVALSPSVAVP